MQFWITFWTVLLLVTVVGFAVLAVVVTIGGLFDIRALLRRINAQHQEDADQQ